jgi:uncharacterized membrane protein
MSREDVLTQGSDARISRLRAIQNWLGDEHARPLDQLKQDYRLRLFQAAEDAQEIPEGHSLDELKADGPATGLATSLRTVLADLRGMPPTAVIVLSDGASTRGVSESLSAAADAARAAGAPIWAVGLGGASAAADRQVSDVLADEVALSGETVTFDVRLRTTETGSPAGKVHLKNADGQIVDSAAWPAISAGEATLKLHDRPTQDGRQDYTIEADALPEEIDLSNNSRSVSVVVRKAKLKALYVERLPRWEFRHLKAALERDPAVDLKTVLLDADLDYVREDRTALPQPPNSASEIALYDVILLGDVAPQSLPEGFLDAVRESVRQGAGLVLIAGPRFNPESYAGTVLEGLLPVALAESEPGVDPQDAQPELTAAGREHPIFQLESENDAASLALPRLTFWATVGVSKTAAVTLATVGPQSQPLVAAQRFGGGQVLWLGTDELWKWRRLREDAIYGRFWSQAVRWVSRARLAGGRLAARLRTDKQVYAPGETIRITLTPPDSEKPQVAATPSITIERPDHSRDAISMTTGTDGIFQATARAEGVGSSRLFWTEAPAGTAVESEFDVRPPGGETAGAPLDRADLIKAAEETHGRYLDWSEIGSLLHDLPAGRRVVSSQATMVPLWNRWGTALLFCTLVCAEWFVRRRNQLI